MIKTPTKLQDLRRKIYQQAKTAPAHRFWGLYVHVCKETTLEDAYRAVRASAGAGGIDGRSFEDIEQGEGKRTFLKEIQQALEGGDYRPSRNREVEIKKDNGKMRKLSIPTIRDRVVQAALKLIIEPIFEADFQEGSYGYRPGKKAGEAVNRVTLGLLSGKTRIIDLDLKAYFDSVKHHILLDKIARRIEDPQILKLIKMMLKASGKQGVPQGSVVSPLFSNIYLNEVDKMLEKAKEVTRTHPVYTNVEYTRWADDLVIQVSWHPSADKAWHQINRRLREELGKLQVEINEEKTRYVQFDKGEHFDFLGFTYRKTTTRQGKFGVWRQPKKKAVQKLRDKIKAIFAMHRSQPLHEVVKIINPILRGWVEYFRIGNSAKVFGSIKDWLNKKMRRHLMRSKGRQGFGWKRWSTTMLWSLYNVYSDFHVRYWKAAPAKKAV
jgi:RNA-directed DNA polymerase